MRPWDGITSVSAGPDANTDIKERRSPVVSRPRTTGFDLDVPAAGDTLSKAFDACPIVLIMLNGVAEIRESVGALQARRAQVFFVLETVSMVALSTEYVTGAWSIVENRWRSEHRHPF